MLSGVVNTYNITQYAMLSKVIGIGSYYWSLVSSII